MKASAEKDARQEVPSVRPGASGTPEERGLRLLLLADSFLPHAGGSRVYYHNLYKHLTEDFPDKVTVLTKKVPGWQEFDARAATDSFRVIRRFRPLPDWKYYQLPKIIFPFIEAFRLLRSGRFDLVHAGDLFPQGLIAMWLKKLLGIPYMIYCHGEEITQTDQRHYQPIIRNSIYRCADGVIAANEFARENLLRIGVQASNIFKVLPGVDSRRFAPRPPRGDLQREFGLQGKTVLLSVGRLVLRKGHGLILRALARIGGNVPPFHYLIAGDGPEHGPILELAAQLGLSDKVTLAGRITEEHLADFYNLCDLFVLANREVEGDLEGFGMVFIEANAAGKPVLGGRTGGTSEAIIENSTGILVDPENPDELTKALQLLLSNADLRHRLGLNGLRRATSEFCWSASARSLRSACETVLRGRRKQPGPQFQQGV